MKYLKDIKEIFENIEIPGLRSGPGSKVESWINIKIDKDLPLRVSRYAKALDEYVDKTDLNGKLEILSSPNSRKFNYGAQCQLSIMILLQYLKEIKSNFEASSAGFLFEDFIAGLLHKKRVGGYKNADFIGDDNRTCQIKFYSKQKGQIKVRSELCDYYIVGLKGAEEAFIWIIDNDGPFTIDEFIIPYYTIENGKYTDNIEYRQINVTALKSLIKTSRKPYILKFKNIDSIIDNIGDKLRDFITNLYNEISELHYNIETIITGINKEQKLIQVKEVEKYYKLSSNNIDNIRNNIKDVKSGILTNIKRKGFDNL